MLSFLMLQNIVTIDTAELKSGYMKLSEMGFRVGSRCNILMTWS